MSDAAEETPRLSREPIVSLDLRYRGLRLPPSAHEKQALARLLERHGQEQAVLASDAVEPGKLVLLDGYKRIDLLASDGVERALTRVVSLDAPAALVAIARANAGRRGVSALEEGWVALALRDEHGLTQAQIAERLGRDRSWVCRRLKLVTDLERQVQDDVRVGLITASVARELVRLPRGNQASAAAAATRHGLTSRQTAKLVGVLLATEPGRRPQVLADPLTHLPGATPSSEPTQDPRLGEQANRLRLQLLRLHAATNRLQEFLLDPPSLAPREEELLRELAAPILARARAVCSRLGAALTLEASSERRHAG